MKPLSMLSLYLKCLEADYVHTPHGGDYALQTEPPLLYLLFEWSDGREDWYNNLNFSAIKVNPTAPKNEQWRAHRGFLKVWRAMEDEVAAEITKQIKKASVRCIVCVGYSHGAALALLATEALSRRFGNTLTVSGYGFGCPRVVKGRLPKPVEQRLTSYHAIRNISDLVTHLPPSILGYRHINLREIGEKGKYGPIEAHTSQAYVVELSRLRPWAPSVPLIPHTHRARE